MKTLKSQAYNSPMRLDVDDPSRHRIGLKIYSETAPTGLFVLVSEPELLDALNATKVEKLESTQRVARQAVSDAAAQCVKAEEKLALVEEAMHEAYNVRGDWMTKAGASALRGALLRAVAHDEFVLPTTPGARFTAVVAEQGFGRVGDTVTFEVVVGHEIMYWKGPGYAPITAERVLASYRDHRLVLDES